MTTRQTAYNLLEKDFSRSLGNKLVSGFIVALILANVTAVIIESYPPIGSRYQSEFHLFNVVSVIIFTIEYLARVWVSLKANDLDESKPVRSRIKYMLTPLKTIKYPYIT